MTDDDNQLIWSELTQLRQDLDALKLRRETLQGHIGELEQMHKALRAEADRAEQLAEQVRNML